jgi:hypothetical protein
MRSGRRIGLIIPLLCFASVPTVRADNAGLSAALHKLFAAGWKNSATALSAALPHYQQAQAAAPQDPRPAYAMALVAIKNSKHEDARKWLGEALARRKDDPAARRALIWVDLLTRQHAAGLSGIQSAAGMLADAESGGSVEQRQALAASLGRMIGYLTAPAGNSVPADELASAESEIFSQLPRSLHVPFVEGKNQTVQKFEEMKAELAQKQDSAAREQTEQKNLAQKKLDEGKGDLQETKDALTEQAQKAREKYDAEESALNKQLEALAGRLKTLDGRARALRTRLLDVDRDIERLIASAALQRGRDPVREAGLLREADRLRLLSRPDREELLRVDQEMVQVRNQGVALEGKVREAQAWLKGELARLNVEGTKLGRAEKGLKNVERQVNEPVTGTNSRVRATVARLSALSTYEEFQLELEKQRLLDSLR